MAYGNADESELIFTSCFVCRRKVKSKLALEYYDPKVLIFGWDGEQKPILRTFCSEECKNKYVNEVI